MSEEGHPDYPNILCGPTPNSHGPATQRFASLVKSVATSATRVGEASNYGLFFWSVLPDDVRTAKEKLREAHKLLLGAHALLHHVEETARLSKAEQKR